MVFASNHHSRRRENVASRCRLPFWTSRSGLRHQSRQGAVSVEFALCVPILFTIMFAAYELAHANMMLHATESAAYEAARVSIVPGSRAEQARTAAAAILNSVGVANFEMSVTTAGTFPQNETVLVEIEVDYQQSSSAFRFFPWSPIMRGRCELSREFL